MIERIGSGHAAPAAMARIHSAGPKKTAVFSVEDFSQQAAEQPAGQINGAAPVNGQFAATFNPTAMWTPGEGFLKNGDPVGPVQNPPAQPFYIANSNYNPADPNSPTTIADPTATAAPQAVTWTSSNGLTTTGIMNPFGLTHNNPGVGFFGVPG